MNTTNQSEFGFVRTVRTTIKLPRTRKTPDGGLMTLAQFNAHMRKLNDDAIRAKYARIMGRATA